MGRTYRAYLDERGHHLVTAARVVAASPGATLVHCGAGKDRTGVTVAMLLDAVGVERSAVVADYAATNDARSRETSVSCTALRPCRWGGCRSG